jgi:hypothetical protein
MKKRLRAAMVRRFVGAGLVLAVVLFLAPLASAQFTTVTGTVTDTNGLAYDCGTISAVLVTPGGASPTLNGVSFTGSMSPIALGCSQQAGTGVSGSFIARLADNNVIVPSGTQWRFTVNISPGILPPAGTGPQTCTAVVTITGGSQSITSSFNACPALSKVSSFPVTTPVTVGSGGSITTTGTGFIVAGSNVNNFFTKFFGLAPQDFGAKGDVHVYNDCGMTANIATLNCTAGHFSSTDCQTGTGCTGPVNKVFEMVCSGGAANPVNGTITSFTSATSVGTSVACTATVTNQGTAFATDDTVALQSWVANSIQAAVKGAPPSARSAYIPSGGYWTTKALLFSYTPNTQDNAGECASGPNNSGGTLRCSLWLMGSGSDNSFIYIPKNFDWTFPNTTSDKGAVYINHWDFFQVNNFAIQAPLANGGTNWNTSGNTGAVGGLVFEDNSHGMTQSMYVDGFSNTGAIMPGMAIVSDFESSYYNSAIEGNDVNLWINPKNIGTSTGQFTAGSYEKLLFDTMFLENSNGSANGDMQVGNANMKQFRMRNIHFRSDSGSLVALNMSGGATTVGGDAFICDECRVTDHLGAGLGIVIQAGGRYVFPELYFENLNDISPNASTVAFLISGGATVTLQGGAINCVSCTNAVNYNGGANTVYAMDLTMTSPTTHANFSRTTSGTGVNNLFLRTPNGWDGPSVIQGTIFAGNLGNTSAVTATNPSASTILMEIPVSAGMFNNLNQSVFVHGNGVFTTAAAQTPTLTFILQLCTGVGGTGTCVTQATWVTNASTASSTNNNWAIDSPITTSAIGAAGTLVVGGYVSADLGATTLLPDTIQGNVNTGSSAATDLTVAEFVSLKVQMSSANAGNSVKQTQMFIK